MPEAGQLLQRTNEPKPFLHPHPTPPAICLPALPEDVDPHHARDEEEQRHVNVEGGEWGLPRREVAFGVLLRNVYLEVDKAEKTAHGRHQVMPWTPPAFPPNKPHAFLFHAAPQLRQMRNVVDGAETAARGGGLGFSAPHDTRPAVSGLETAAQQKPPSHPEQSVPARCENRGSPNLGAYGTTSQQALHRGVTIDCPERAKSAAMEEGNGTRCSWGRGGRLEADPTSLLRSPRSALNGTRSQVANAALVIL